MTNSVKKFVFVLMPFDESFNDIYDYGIKQTCIDQNAYCERVDEQIFNERILDRIYNQISKADLIIADMTLRNPNVFYEVGYAHGIGKNVILLTQNLEDIPFDLKHFPHIIYNKKIKLLSDSLKIKLNHFLEEENTRTLGSIEFDLDFLIEGNKISNNSIINISNENKINHYDYHSVKLDVYNNSSKTYSTVFKVGFEFHETEEKLIQGLEMIKPSAEKVLFVSNELSNIYPNAYSSFTFKIRNPITFEFKPKERIVDCKLKIFTILGLIELSFKMKICSPPIESDF